MEDRLRQGMSEETGIQIIHTQADLLLRRCYIV